MRSSFLANFRVNAEEHSPGACAGIGYAFYDYGEFGLDVVAAPEYPDVFKGVVQNLGSMEKWAKDAR